VDAAFMLLERNAAWLHDQLKQAALRWSTRPPPGDVVVMIRSGADVQPGLADV